MMATASPLPPTINMEGDGLRLRLIELFQQIEQERMRDVPVLNEALSVAAFGFDCADEAGFAAGILVTPWFMNLLLMPVDPALLAGLQVGDKRNHALPGGQFEFIVSFEDSLGCYLSCSLFSPMFQFADQQAAIDTAEAVLTMVMDPDAGDGEQGAQHPSQDAQDMQAIWDGNLPDPVAADGGPVATDDMTETGSQSEAGSKSEIGKKAVDPQPSRRDLLLGLRSSRTLAADGEPLP